MDQLAPFAVMIAFGVLVTFAAIGLDKWRAVKRKQANKQRDLFESNKRKEDHALALR